MSFAAAVGDLFNQGAAGYTKVAASKPMNAIRGLNLSAGAARAHAVASQMYGGMKKQVLNQGFAAQAGLMGAVGGTAGYFAGDHDLGGTAKGAGLGVLGAFAHRGVRVGRASPLMRSELSAAGAGLRRARKTYGSKEGIKNAWNKSWVRNQYYDMRAQGAANRLGLEPWDMVGGTPQGRLNFNAPTAGPAGPTQMGLF